jgi:hypothetical protein
MHLDPISLQQFHKKDLESERPGAAAEVSRAIEAVFSTSKSPPAQGPFGLGADYLAGFNAAMANL